MLPPAMAPWRGVVLMCVCVFIPLIPLSFLICPFACLCAERRARRASPTKKSERGAV